ncbi:hypothetical protein ZOSMA_117G00880 [Zostera marina]|uniref:Uncharacterized protein n=1 Tax=Zostera marina TaxID=29655 RepID=A0A0K9Q1Y6_ZOSMR|nr:hypothetical protein ZOSMA_117G00880 [Zostera marina]
MLARDLNSIAEKLAHAGGGVRACSALSHADGNVRARLLGLLSQSQSRGRRWVALVIRIILQAIQSFSCRSSLHTHRPQCVLNLTHFQTELPDRMAIPNVPKAKEPNSI